MERKRLNHILQFMTQEQSPLHRFITAAASPTARDAVQRSDLCYKIKNITISHDSPTFSPFFLHLCSSTDAKTNKSNLQGDTLPTHSVRGMSSVRSVRHVTINGAWSKSSIDACKWWLQRQSNEPLALTWSTQLNNIDKAAICLSDFPQLWHFAIHTSHPLRHLAFGEQVQYHNLQYLDLKRAQFLLDLSFLSQCPRLRGLYAWDTGVAQLTPLLHCPSLEILIFSISAYLPTLTVKSLNCIGKLHQLRVLKISLPRSDSIEWLKQCTLLQQLAIIGFTGVTDWTPLRSLSKLRLLHITSTAFNDLSAIVSTSSSINRNNNNNNGNNRLQELSLALCTNIQHFTEIGQLRWLRSLRIVQSSIDDITWITNCTQLMIVEFSHCLKLIILSALSQLELLRVLKLSQVRVQDLSWLAQCKHLHEVQLKALRRVRKMSDLAALKDLHVLKVYDLLVQDLN